MKKVGHNMFLDGNKFISFTTHVATIDGDKLIENGKYSATTSKHVSKFANARGLKVVRSKERPEFNMLWSGVVINLDKLKKTI
jgi:hypothetical protein